MKRILVTYTTNAGSTEEVAQKVASELGANGASVEVSRLEAVASVEAYDIVVIGAPMILGWHRSAVSFVKKHQEALAQKRVAYFCTLLSLTQPNKLAVGATPIYVDPLLPKPPKNAKRLSIKEAYATADNYLAPALKAAPAVRPESVAFLGGKLEMFRLKWWQMLFVMIIIQAQPGDQRNWQAVEAWCAHLCEIFMLDKVAN